MSDYSNTYGGASKDSGNDIILGAQLDTQFDAVSVASQTKLDEAGGTMTGVLDQNDNTDSTTGGTGSIHTDGGIGAVKEIVTDATFKPIGDTASSDLAAFGHTIVDGAILTGQGSTNDVVLKNDADGIALRIPTGATDVLTPGTFKPEGDTGSSDLAALGYDSTNGAILTGQGSTNDVVLKNDADAIALRIPTGTQNVHVVADLDVTGDAVVDGTQLVTGVLTATATSVHTGGITSGSNIVSDADSTDDLGTTGVRWQHLYVDAMTVTDGISQANLASASVGQAELKTTSGSVSSTTTDNLLTLPGGAYGFYPQIKGSNDGTTNNASIGGHDTVPKWDTTYLTRIVLDESGAATASARQRYIQASPPYNLGDGDIPLFVFLHIDNTTQEIVSTYVAPEAPWHYNGPTSIRAQRIDQITGKTFRSERDLSGILSVSQAKSRNGLAERAVLIREAPMMEFEITQSIKNADMKLVPHPFSDTPGRTVVMLDPISSLMEDLRNLHDDGESIVDLLHEGFVSVGTDPLVREGPEGVMIPSARWK